MIGVISFLLSVFGLTAWLATFLATWLSTWWPISPLWALLPLALLFVYGLMKANYEAFRGVEQENERLQSKLALAAKRKAAKDLLGDAMDEGNILRQSHRKNSEEKIKFTSHQDVVDWVERTHNLIEAAFDKAEARHFMNSDDYKPEKPLPWREVRVDPYRYHVIPRLRRLDQLIVRASELPLNPDFDPQHWKGSGE